jgi:AhpD family alkylhydroperoxidase
LRGFKRSPEWGSHFGRTLKAGWHLAFSPRRERISPAYSEKIMLAVTGVNQCAFCSWLHTRTALAKGVGLDEIQALLGGDLSGLSEEEAAGVLYAQHWADTQGRVSPEARQRMLDTYGAGRTRQIEAFIQMVYFGNLCSNTVVMRRKVREAAARPSLFVVWLAWPIATFIRIGGRRGRAALQG